MNEQERFETMDVPFYSEVLAPVLPPRVLDFHTHIWSCSSWGVKPWESDNEHGKYMVTRAEYPVETLMADGQRCFPDRPYEAVIFGYPMPMTDRAGDTKFILDAARTPGVYPFVLAGKDYGIERAAYMDEVREHNFLGFKILVNWLGNDYGDKTVEDMIGVEELTAADELGLVILLHVPRSGRLADPVVQRGVQWVSRECPNAHVVLAHCGRCYMPEEMTRAIDSVKDLENVYMDISMVMDPIVLQIALENMGSGRLLYGSDFPVAAMRGRRVRVMDHWVDVVLDEYPASEYRVQSNGIRATFMAVEIAVALKQAAERSGTSASELKSMFYDNGMALLEHVMNGEQLKRVRENWVLNSRRVVRGQ